MGAALSIEIDLELGRRQMARHRVLVPAFGGSNPPAPASFTVRNERNSNADPVSNGEEI